MRRERGGAAQERARDPCRDRERLVDRQRRELHGVVPQLEQRKRVARGRAVEPVRGLRGHRAEKPCGGGPVETVEDERRQSGAFEQRRLVRAHPEEHGDGIGDQPAHGEEHRLRARAVEPVRVVDHDEQRLVLGVGRQQAERRRPHREPVARVPGTEGERALERRSLRRRDRRDRAEGRPQQLEQAGERDVRLRLDPARAQDAQVGRALDGGVEQRRLPDPRLADEHQHAARPHARAGDEPGELLELPVATEQHARRRLGAHLMRWKRAAPSFGAQPTKEGTMATLENPTAIDGAKLEAFVFRAVDEVGATLNAALVVMGDKLGLYRALAGAGPLTPDELASRTGTAERYVREWLNNQAAGGYVEYDPETGRYLLPPEQAMALTDESSPAYIPGFFQIAIGSVLDSPRITEVVRTGEGIGWHDHVHDVHEGCERFFRPGYNANLIASWLPALDGVVEKLERGAKVADVGCGHGASTILMAQAFPNSTFVGSDYHDGSIATARQRAEEAGVADRVSFEVAPAASYSGTDYDLVTMFDCLHDMGDPAGAARHVRETLAADGTWMIVEPAAGDRVEDNLNPVGRAYYGFSTLLCTPASLSQEVGLALGAQAGEARIRDVVTSSGLTRFRRAAETPFNLVFEARP